MHITETPLWLDVMQYNPTTGVVIKRQQYNKFRVPRALAIHMFCTM